MQHPSDVQHHEFQMHTPTGISCYDVEKPLLVFIPAVQRGGKAAAEKSVVYLSAFLTRFLALCVRHSVCVETGDDSIQMLVGSIMQDELPYLLFPVGNDSVLRLIGAVSKQTCPYEHGLMRQ